MFSSLINFQLFKHFLEIINVNFKKEGSLVFDENNVFTPAKELQRVQNMV